MKVTTVYKEQDQQNSHVLLLDIGNTQLKYALFDRLPTVDAEMDIHTIIHIDDLREVFQRFIGLLRCVVSNVSNEQAQQSLEQLAQEFEVELVSYETKNTEHGLTNSYHTPTNMGVDRWLAMLACHVRSDGNFIVFDLGTAITTDAVIDSQHIGGWICPGYQTLKSSLLSNTNKVFSDDQRKQYRNHFGDDTPDCVELGLRSQIQGSFELALRKMDSLSENYEIFITGGNRGLLNLEKYPRAQLVDNLVIRGLLLHFV